MTVSLGSNLFRARAVPYMAELLGTDGTARDVSLGGVLATAIDDSWIAVPGFRWRHLFMRTPAVDNFGSYVHDVLEPACSTLATARVLKTRPEVLRIQLVVCRGTVDELSQFLDVCGRWHAQPAFSIQPTDWRDATVRKRDRLWDAVDKLDYELHARGFDKRVSARLLRAVHRLSASIDGVRRVTSTVWLSRRASSELVAAAPVRRLRSPSSSVASETESTPVRTLSLDRRSMARLPDALASMNASVRRLAVRIPYWSDGRALSALELLPAMRALRAWADDAGVTVFGNPQPARLGMRGENRDPLVSVVTARLPAEELPIAIVTPVYDRGRHVAEYIRSLRQVTCRFQLILVDDGSNDASLRNMIAACRSDLRHVPVTVLTLARDQPYRPGEFSFRAGVARNAARPFVRGRRVLFLDPDEIIDEECLAHHAFYGDMGFDVVIGYRTYAAPERYSLRERYLMRSCQRTPRSQQPWWCQFYSGNSSIAAKTLDASGWFDSSLHYWCLEDSDLGFRLFLNNATVWRTSRARVVHQAGEGGGEGRLQACWLTLEVMLRKFLDPQIVSGFRFLLRAHGLPDETSRL